MGSKLYYRILAKLHILVLCMGLFVILGCPDPNMHIWFISGDKLVQELKLRFVDNRISMKLLSHSSFGNEYGKYRLQIRANLQFPREMKNDLLFSPKTAKIYFGEHLLERDSTHDGYLIKYIDTLSEDKYAVALNFSYDMRTDGAFVKSCVN